MYYPPRPDSLSSPLPLSLLVRLHQASQAAVGIHTLDIFSTPGPQLTDETPCAYTSAGISAAPVQCLLIRLRDERSM